MWGVILILSLIGLLFYAVTHAVQFPADEPPKKSGTLAVSVLKQQRFAWSE